MREWASKGACECGSERGSKRMKKREREGVGEGMSEQGSDGVATVQASKGLRKQARE